MNLINLTTDEYPSSLYQVRQAHPNVSFSSDPSDEDLAPFGFANVHPSPLPEYDYRTQRVVEGDPQADSDNIHRQTWVIRDATPGEITDYDTAHLPPPDWKGFATEAMSNTEVNSLLGSVLAQSPGLYGGLTVGLGQASQGDPTMFTSSWAYVMNTGLVSISVINLLQSLANQYNLPIDLSNIDPGV